MKKSFHLTDDEIDDYLMGDLAAEPAAHLQVCDPCQECVAELQTPLANFKAVSLAWGERQSATIPLKPAGFPPKLWRRHAIWAATAAALVVGIAVPLAYREAASVHTTEQAEATQPVNRDEQIAQDNRMLQAIDRELDASVSSPSEEFGLSAVRTHSQERASTAQLRD